MMNDYDKHPYAIFNKFGTIVSKIYSCKAGADIDIYYVRRASVMKDDYFSVKPVCIQSSK